jgi:hypothetical protein
MERQIEQSQLAGIDPLLGRDLVIRNALIAAVASGRVTPKGLALLRDHYGLTPAETLVFVRYYLAHGNPGTRSHRQLVSNQLCLSENTLMHHVTSIRRKLGIVARRGSANVLLWSLSAGIVNLDAVMPQPVAPGLAGEA